MSVEAPAGDLGTDAAAVLLEADELPEVEEAEADLGPAAGLYGTALEAHRAGDHERAVSILREARILSPQNAIIESGLTAALEQLGADRLTGEHFEAAEAALAEVVGRGAERGPAWKALGYAQLRQNRPPDARASLERAVRLLPDDAQAHLLLGHALHRSGDAAGALVELRAGRTAATGDPSYEALVSRLEREATAEQGFSKAESAHFTVSFEGGGKSEQAGYLVSLLLEDAYHSVGGRLDYYPTDAVHAVLYAAEEFRDVTRSPAWAGALFDGKIRLPVGGLTDRTEALQRTVAHEYTHALVHRLAGGRAPVWLNEGLAQLSEGPFDAQARDRLRAYLRGGGRVTSLRSLEGSFTGLDAAQARLAYMQSLAAADLLVTQYGAPASRRVLDRLAAGVSLPAAIEEVLYVSYEDFDRQWVESYR